MLTFLSMHLLTPERLTLTELKCHEVSAFSRFNKYCYFYSHFTMPCAHLKHWYEI